MKLRHFVIIPIAASGLISASCTTSTAEYTDPDKAEILDDRWSETDLKKTASFLVDQVLARPWLPEYKSKNGGKAPVVLVDQVENRTEEVIDTKALTEYIQDELINSRKVRFVGDVNIRKKLLDELKYQNSGAVSEKTAKKTGNQTGADYLLEGSIATSTHSKNGGGEKTIYYLTTMRLTNIETGEIEWTGKKELKKAFKRSSLGL
jgi:uncharacterized protein (TIGR02722 family)